MRRLSSAAAFVVIAALTLHAQDAAASLIVLRRESR